MCQFKPASGLFHWPTGLPWLLYLLKHAHGLSVLCHANKTCSDNRYFLSLVCASPWEYNVAPDPMPSLSSGRLGWWTSAGLACSEPSPLSDSSLILHWRADPTRFRWVRSQHPLPKVSIQTWLMSISTGYFASTGKTEFSYLWGFFFFFFWLLFFFLAALCGMGVLSSPTRYQTLPPAVKAQSLNHWTTGPPGKSLLCGF